MYVYLITPLSQVFLQRNVFIYMYVVETNAIALSDVVM